MSCIGASIAALQPEGNLGTVTFVVAVLLLAMHLTFCLPRLRCATGSLVSMLHVTNT